MNTVVPEKCHYFPQPPSFFVPPRLDKQELLDLGVGSIQDVQANFADLWRINYFLGGMSALTHHLYPRIINQRKPSTVVDVGAGSADIITAVAHWARQHNTDLKLFGLDLSSRHLGIARLKHPPEPTISLIQADALDLPFQAGQVDYFISCLFLHHLSPKQAIDFLARTFASARRGIIMSDIVRGRLPFIGFKLSQPIFARSFLTRYDGAASIRRAYTPDELRQLAQSAGLSKARVYQHFPWRMTLVAEK
ncbi:MAG: methyltransferase domain-containing protein [Chloroflexota bacterium]